MKTIIMVQFGEEDASDIRRITEWCNEAVSFFQDRETLKEPITVPAGTPIVISAVLNIGYGTRAIQRLSSGNSLTIKQVEEALAEIVTARARVLARVPDQLFPQELQTRYANNLAEAGAVVQHWLEDAMGC